MGHKHEYGCIMAILEQSFAEKVVKLGKKLIPNEILYEEPGEEFGREMEPHITIKFGLTKIYSKEKMGEAISKIKPFQVTLIGISIFQNEKFDVVKIDAESEKLKRYNKIFSKLPNEDEHPIYHPHLTLAYVFSGSGKKFENKFHNPIEVLISQIKYSNPEGKYYYNLN